MIIVYYTPKPHSNYEGPYSTEIEAFEPPELYQTP